MKRRFTGYFDCGEELCEDEEVLGMIAGSELCSISFSRLRFLVSALFLLSIHFSNCICDYL